MTQHAGASATYPLRIGRVELVVHDLATVSQFYERIIGLQRLAEAGDALTLGAGGVPLLTLRHDPQARRRDPEEPGLFHTAFLLPSREDLGRWLAWAARAGAPLGGAAYHLVSEAIYLADPEGNGVEVYADQPAAQWTWRDGLVQMDTLRLDLAPLLRAPGYWSGAPAGTRVGHVHLQTGDLRAAEAFYAGVAGLDVTCRYPGAVFLASGGYHHQVAANVWNSRGAPAPARPCTGLAAFELLADGPARVAAIAARTGASPGADGVVALTDPAGVNVIIRAGAPA
ncbi:VOC family protein [Camelimonas abortus]|uniref:VOC family protein n=1 Tax=Camelimonas abortus TaxID=1017184 RepID=A0ABV7LCP8_9HYPH